MEARDSFCFPKNTKNPNPSPIGKKFGFCWCGAPPGTRTLGPLIKRANRRFVSIYGSFESSLFLIKSTWFFTQQFLHPLSDFAARSTLCTFWNRAKSVQKPCTYSLTNKIALSPPAWRHWFEWPHIIIYKTQLIQLVNFHILKFTLHQTRLMLSFAVL